MSSSDRITCSKGKLEGFSIPYVAQRGKGKGRKSTNKQNQQELAHHPTSAIEGLDQLQQQAVVWVSPLPAQPPRPTSFQSFTGPKAGERPPSRALSVVDGAGSRPESTPPQLDISKLPWAPANTVPPLSADRVGAPWVPFQTIS